LALLILPVMLASIRLELVLVKKWWKGAMMVVLVMMVPVMMVLARLVNARPLLVILVGVALSCLLYRIVLLMMIVRSGVARHRRLRVCPRLQTNSIPHSLPLKLVC
jgi:hypothetical protein